MLRLRKIQVPEEDHFYLVKYKGGVFVNNFHASNGGYFGHTDRGEILSLQEIEEIYEIQEITETIDKDAVTIEMRIF